jgi:hypothetical protein
VKSESIDDVNVIKTRSIQGKVTRKTVKIAMTRGANENVWSWIDVRVWMRLTTTPTSIATASIGPTIHISVVRAFCIIDVTKASFIAT